MGNRLAYSLGAPPVWHGMARTQKNIGDVVPILTTDLTLGSTVALFKVPANFVLNGASIDLPQLDTGNTLSVSLGDAASPTRLLNASTAARTAGGTAGVPIAFGARGYRFPADTEIVMTVAAAAATAVAGSVVVFLHGHIEP